MSFAIWTYRRPFTAEGVSYEVVLAVSVRELSSTLLREGRDVARDRTPNGSPEGFRNHRLSDTLPSGTPLDVTAGYVGLWTAGIRAAVSGRTIHESHPGRAIEFPKRLRRASEPDPGYDPDNLKRNRVPIAVDIALGALFFLVGWFTDLTTAAIVGAVAALLLVVAQRFTRVDLLGGLALFGTVMLVASAALALVLDSGFAVQLRTTILGLASGTLFLLDGWTGGERLGRGLSRYLAYSDIDVRRLSLGMGAMTIALAALNLGVALLVTERFWLVYSTFLDVPLVMAGFLLVIRWARAKPETVAG